MATSKKSTPEKFVKDIRNNTRRIFTAEQKILIVMEALRAETSIAELCRKYSISQSQFYKWNKEFLEAGKSDYLEILLEKLQVMMSVNYAKKTSV